MTPVHHVPRTRTRCCLYVILLLGATIYMTGGRRQIASRTEEERSNIECVVASCVGYYIVRSAQLYSHRSLLDHDRLRPPWCLLSVLSSWLVGSQLVVASKLEYCAVPLKLVATQLLMRRRKQLSKPEEARSQAPPICHHFLTTNTIDNRHRPQEDNRRGGGRRKKNIKVETTLLITITLFHILTQIVLALIQVYYVHNTLHTHTYIVIIYLLYIDLVFEQ